MAAPVPLRPDFDAAALRTLAKQSCDPDQTRRLLALATIYDGQPRSEAARIGCVTVQSVRDWVVRCNAQGPAGLINGKAPGRRATGPTSAPEPDPAGGSAGHRRARTHSGHPRSGALATGRSDCLALGGVPPLDLPADAVSRIAGSGLSQALGPSAPLCPERARGGRF